MSKIQSYLKSKGPWWYISNLLLALIISVLLIPSWRQAFNVFWLRMLQGSPQLEQTSIEVSDDSYRWDILSIDNEKWFKFGETKGKVVFLNFWATWCGPCVAEMKSIQELYEAYRNEVEFIMISTEPIEKIINFKKYHQYTLPFHSIANVPREFNTNKYPTTYIINKEGNIVIKEFGAHDWNSDEVQNLLDDLIEE